MIIHITDPHFQEKTKVLSALHGVIDPELNVNLVDLGMIYDIIFEEQGIRIIMTLSTPHCPMGESIINAVGNTLGDAFPEKEIMVELSWEPQWDISMVTEEGLNQLGI